MPLINRKYSTFKRPKQKIKYPWQRNDSRYYNTPTWKKLRYYYLMNHPLCEMHLQHNKIVPASCVHHKHIFMSGNTDEDKWALFTNENNLCAVCDECHKEFHRQLKSQNKVYLPSIVPTDIKDNEN